MDQGRDAPDTEYKYSLFLRQFLIERIFAQWLDQHGVKVERPMEVIDFDILDDSVISKLKGKMIYISNSLLCILAVNAKPTSLPKKSLFKGRFCL